jgi:hypothetical protein
MTSNTVTADGCPETSDIADIETSSLATANRRRHTLAWIYLVLHGTIPEVLACLNCFRAWPCEQAQYLPRPRKRLRVNGSYQPYTAQPASAGGAR